MGTTCMAKDYVKSHTSTCHEICWLCTCLFNQACTQALCLMRAAAAGLQAAAAYDCRCTSCRSVTISHIGSNTGYKLKGFD